MMATGKGIGRVGLQRICLLFCTLLAIATSGRADLTPYGKMQVEYFTESTGDLWARGLRYSPGNNMFGINGSDAFGGGNTLVYQIQLRPGSERPCGHGLSNSFGGLTGPWGTLVVGTHSPPTDISVGKSHMNYHTLLSPCDLLGAAGLVRTGVLYISPSYDGFQMAQLLPLSNEAVTNDVAFIFSDDPYFISVADQELTHPDGEERHRTDFSFNLMNWDGFTFGLYRSWLRKSDAKGASGLFAWPEGQEPERETWRLEYGLEIGDTMIKVQTGAVTERDDGRRSRFSSIAFDRSFSERRKIFTGQMRTVTEIPGRPSQVQTTQSHGLIHKF